MLNLVKTFLLPTGAVSFANLAVRVRLAGTKNPARIYSKDGVLASQHGHATLSATGNIDVWVQEGQSFDLELYNTQFPFSYGLYQAVDPKQVVSLLPPVAAAVTETGTVRTLTKDDAGKYLRFTATGAKTVTVGGVTSEMEIKLANRGTGVLTIVPDSGITVNASALTLANGASATLKWISATVWDLV